MLLLRSGFPFQNLSSAQYPQAGRLVPRVASRTATFCRDCSHLPLRAIGQRWQRAMQTMGRWPRGASFVYKQSATARRVYRRRAVLQSIYLGKRYIGQGRAFAKRRLSLLLEYFDARDSVLTCQCLFRQLFVCLSTSDPAR